MNSSSIHSANSSACEAEGLSSTTTYAVAALILTYNHEAYIEICLRSILECGFADMHLWVLDDGSTDGTCAIIRRIAEETGRVTLLTQTNSGGRTAANTQRLIDESQGEYILFMSGDDLLGPCFPLSRTVARLEAEDSLAFVLPRLIPFTQDPCQSASSSYSKALLVTLRSADPELVLREHLHLSVSRIFLQGVVVRRSLIRDMGGFDSVLISDDYAFIFRLFRHLADFGRGFFFDEESLWLYRIHDGNIHRAALRQFRLIVEVVAKYVPEKCRANFLWDVMAFESSDDLVEAQEVALCLLGPEVSKVLMRKIMKSTLRLARKSANIPLLRIIVLESRQIMHIRIRAFILIIRITCSKWLGNVECVR